MSLATSKLPSEEDLARICYAILTNRTDSVLSRHEGGNAVVAFSDDLVVKIGGDVTRDEFENQERAHEILMPVNSVKVPQPYAFFRRQGLGYLVMEHIHGEQIQPSDPSSVQKVVDMLRVFATIRGEKPGSLGGGPSRGLLWSEYHDFKPESIKDVEEHFSASIKDGSEIALYPYPLTLCHGDLAERNIKICENQLCILDWASAGFYPKLFEIAAMQRNTVEPLLMKVLQSVQEIAWLNENESFLANCIERAASSNIRYISGLGKLKPVRPRRPSKRFRERNPEQTSSNSNFIPQKAILEQDFKAK